MHNLLDPVLSLPRLKLTCMFVFLSFFFERVGGVDLFLVRFLFHEHQWMTVYSRSCHYIRLQKVDSRTSFSKEDCHSDVGLFAVAHRKIEAPHPILKASFRLAERYNLAYTFSETDRQTDKRHRQTDKQTGKRHRQTETDKRHRNRDRQRQRQTDTDRE